MHLTSTYLCGLFRRVGSDYILDPQLSWDSHQSRGWPLTAMGEHRPVSSWCIRLHACLCLLL